jgi:hypothetical protein
MTMTTYAKINACWPKPPYPVPTDQEAIAGVKALIRVARRLAKDDGKDCKLYDNYAFKIVRGNRHSKRVRENRGMVWYINPNLRGYWGWHHLVHTVSHWANRYFWSAPEHGLHHAWLEGELTDYAVNNLIAGQLRKPEKPKQPVDLIEIRRKRVAASLQRWETKLRRAENAIRKLKRKEARYARATTGRLVRDTSRPIDTEVFAAAA